jgi:hypothetical protein
MGRKKTIKRELDPRIIKIAEKLKKIRIEKGFTSYENFAWDNGLVRQQYWRMEKGCYFNIESLLKILDVHKITMEDFFKGIQ